jgi:hypothetical protein
MSIKQFFNSSLTSNSRPKKIIIEESEDDIIQIRLNNLLEPFKTNEFIPNNIMDVILSTAMPSVEIIHTYSERHFIAKVKINDLLNSPVTNWKYNRPPDIVKCSDMAKYVYLSKKPLDTMLYLSFNNVKKMFDVIDGIHRYTSLKILKENNTKSLDLITPSDYGNNNDAKWLYESYIILNIRFNAIEGELIELFKTLNKSTPIAELYIKDFVKEKREIIENVSNNWQVKYKSHFSSSNKPNKPNINRDRFLDLLESVYVKYNINEENKNKLEQLLDRANWNISNNVPLKLSPTIIEKCKASGCWLFIYSDDKLIKMI